MDAGLSVARINFSHSTHDQHAATIALVRETAKSLGRPVGILGDLQVPLILVGDLPKPLSPATWRLHVDEAGPNGPAAHDVDLDALKDWRDIPELSGASGKTALEVK